MKQNPTEECMQFHKKACIFLSVPYYPQETYKSITAVQKEWTGCVILRDVHSAADNLSALTSADNWSQAIFN